MSETRKFLAALVLTVIFPVGVIEGWNDLHWLYWDRECRRHHFNGARPNQYGLIYRGWQCWITSGDWKYEVNVGDAKDWELEALNLRRLNDP